MFLPASTTAGTSARDGCTTTRHTDTATADVAAAEHGRVAKHVGDDEESDVGAADVDLVEVGDAAVARRDGNVLELDVHVVLGWVVTVSETNYERDEGKQNGMVGFVDECAYLREACRGMSVQR